MANSSFCLITARWIPLQANRLLWSSWQMTLARHHRMLSFQLYQHWLRRVKFQKQTWRLHWGWPPMSIWLLLILLMPFRAALQKGMCLQTLKKWLLPPWLWVTWSSQRWKRRVLTWHQKHSVPWWPTQLGILLRCLVNFQLKHHYHWQRLPKLHPRSLCHRYWIVV